MNDKEVNIGTQLVGKKLLVSVSPLPEVKSRDYDSHSDGGSTGRSDQNDTALHRGEE